MCNLAELIYVFDYTVEVRILYEEAGCFRIVRKKLF